MARRRISGTKLAEAIGKSQAYVSRRLTGDTPFDTDDLEVIARTLGVTIIDLLPRTEQVTGIGRRAVTDDGAGHVLPTGADRSLNIRYSEPAPIRDRSDTATTRPGRPGPSGTRGPGRRPRQRRSIA